MLETLDRISEDDDDAILPTSTEVFLIRSKGAVRVPGLADAFELDDNGDYSEGVHFLTKYVQRHVDQLKNSEVAEFLCTNRRRSADKTCSAISVKVPRIVVDAVDAMLRKA